MSKKKKKVWTCAYMFIISLPQSYLSPVCKPLPAPHLKTPEPAAPGQSRQKHRAMEAQQSQETSKCLNQINNPNTDIWRLQRLKHPPCFNGLCSLVFHLLAEVHLSGLSVCSKHSAHSMDTFISFLNPLQYITYLRGYLNTNLQTSFCICWFNDIQTSEGLHFTFLSYK